MIRTNRSLEIWSGSAAAVTTTTTTTAATARDRFEKPVTSIKKYRLYIGIEYYNVHLQAYNDSSYRLHALWFGGRTTECSREPMHTRTTHDNIYRSNQCGNPSSPRRWRLCDTGKPIRYNALRQYCTATIVLLAAYIVCNIIYML